MSTQPIARWYVVQTQPRAEERARLHLDRQGFETYLPRYQKRRRHARRVDVVAAPFFPRYLFVLVDLATQRWRSIHSTFGVSRLVCNGTVPAPVPGPVIMQLRDNEDELGFIKIRRPQFAAGDRVRVVEGAFSDCLGLFEAESSEKRVAILLDLLGRKVRVLLDAQQIAMAEAS